MITALRRLEVAIIEVAGERTNHPILDFGTNTGKPVEGFSASTSTGVGIPTHAYIS